MIRLAAISLVFLVSCDLAVVGFRGHTADPSPRGPEEACFNACAARASRCSRHECARGCNLVLDRLVEHEGEPVLACVARAKSSCGDRTWAGCAARIGVHADGGPPAPPPSDDTEEDE